MMVWWGSRGSRGSRGTVLGLLLTPDVFGTRVRACSAVADRKVGVEACRDSEALSVVFVVEQTESPR